MAEFQSFATAVGRHGNADPTSNIDPTDVRSARIPLGYMVDGYDSAGYWGRWWWGIYGETITVTSTTKPMLTIDDAAISATIMWTAVQTTGASTSLGYPFAAGTVETSVTATFYGWVRSAGYVPGMTGVNSGTRTIGLPVGVTATAAGTLNLYAGAGQIVGWLAATSTTAVYDVHLRVPFIGLL